MTPEELLKTLRDGGLDDESIKKLLGDTIASLEGPAKDEKAAPEEEKAKAEQLLGVAL